MPRSIVTNPQAAPWKFVGKWLTGTAFGSGVLVGDRYFLSAGHIAPGGVFLPGSSPEAQTPFGGAGVDPAGPSYRVFTSGGSPDIQLVRMNWGASGGMGTPLDQRPGHISLFEVDMGVYRLLDPNKPSHMTQMGTCGSAFSMRLWGELHAQLYQATVRFLACAVVALIMVGTASADERFWCLDEGSSGYILDPQVPAGQDKSRPQAFIRTHTAMRLSGDKVFLNFQGLGEKEHICSTVSNNVMQCVGRLTLFSFDKTSHRFNLAQLPGNMDGSTESLVLRFGQCRATP